MEEGIRLNKLLSGAGVCSRRDADRFIEMGRVTVNGKIARVGQRIIESDIVMLDDIKVKISMLQKYSFRSMGKTRNLIFGDELSDTEYMLEERKKKKAPAEKKEKKKSSSGELRPGKYVHYNKYAAARKAAKRDEGGSGAAERGQAERRTR